MSNEASKNTGPARILQGPVSAAEQGSGSELYMLVLNDVIERAEFGRRKYGLPLRETADVDFALNAYQEILDLLIYFRGQIQRNVLVANLLEDALALITNVHHEVPSGVVRLETGAEDWFVHARRWTERYLEVKSQLDTE